MLTAERLRELVEYDPETGLFRSKSRYHRCTYGKIIGHKRDGGYLKVHVEGHQHRAHRLAWLYVYGEWPPTFIDHIDGNPANNKISNLRLATKQQNGRNRRAMSRSGLKGVSLDKRRGLWRARIKVAEKHMWLGYHPTKEAAAEAYAVAARKYFGEFARA